MVSCVKASDEGKDRWYLVSNMRVAGGENGSGISAEILD